MSVGVLDKERVFFCESGCCGVNTSVLDKVWLFWFGIGYSWNGCGCSGKGAGVLEWVRVFWIGCEFSGVDAGVLDKV